MTTYRHVDTGETVDADTDSAVARFEQSRAWKRVGEKPQTEAPAKKAAKKTAKKATRSDS